MPGGLGPRGMPAGAMPMAPPGYMGAPGPMPGANYPVAGERQCTSCSAVQQCFKASARDARCLFATALGCTSAAVTVGHTSAPSLRLIFPVGPAHMELN